MTPATCEAILAALVSATRGEVGVRVPVAGDDAHAAAIAAAVNELLESSERRLAEAHRELEAFSYAVAHDVRTPLRGIDGFSQLVLEDHGEVLPPEGLAQLRRVRAGAQRMAELIDDVLYLAWLARCECKRQHVDVTAIVDSILSARMRAEPERSVDVVVEEGMFAEADPYLVRLVFDCLLDNAWKFTAHTQGPRIEVGKREADGEVIFFVRDNGVGFEMKHATRLFEAFHRLHPGALYPGTGIGLAASHRVATKHGGRLWATSTVGEGSTFELTLAPKEAVL